MLSHINIEGGQETESFLRLLDKTVDGVGAINGVPATQSAREQLRARILGELDARRFAQVDDILREAATRFPNLEAAVRTGSSGLRHLGKDTGGGYRPLLSDDDITFVGEGAQEAKTWFNQQVKNRGLGGVKVKGFTLNDPGKFSRQDKAILDLLDPEKFVGQSAMSGIRGETMKKGAVVLAKGPDGKLSFTRVSLADHLSNLKSTRSALDSFIDNAARKYGPLTMTASVERQIVTAHKGWDNLTGSEKVKYMLRSRKKLNESRGVATDASVSKLEEMASRFSKFPPPEITPDEAAFLLKLRRENIVEGFKAANNRLFLQSLGARRTGGNLAANPQVREAIDELATGFAMLKDLGGKPEFKGMVDVDEMIQELIKNAEGNPELKKMLYTASKQAEDMLAVLNQWAGMEDEFAAMLARLPAMTPAQRAKALADRRAALSGGEGAGVSAQARKHELALVDEMSKAAATKEGDALVVAMVKSPAGKKVLVALAMGGGAAAFSKMYERWKDGGWYGDLSSAASTLADFLPGAMSFERLKKDGYVSPGLAYQFVKESMYLTALWPAALSADLAEMAYDSARAVTVNNYKDGLVDILETHGVFEDGRFTALKLPDGETIPRDRLAAFLKEDKTVKLANTNRPDLFYRANLSKKAAEVYAHHYVENDPVLGDLKKALIQQIGRINVGEAMGQITDQQWLEAAKSGFRMLFAVEGVCTKLPRQWCELVTIYQNKIKERADDIFPNVMVPHLISLAEDAHKALTGSDEAVKRIMEIQRDLEALRGSPLGVDLAQETAQRAAKASDLRVTPLSGDTSTKRDKALAEGGYLQAALKAYETILKEARDTLQDIVDRTGNKNAQVLAFPFSGDFFQDAAKARQSRRGFMSATNTIVQDVAKIKGSAPDVLDETDLKALGILAEVAYRNRTALDQANSAKVGAPKDPASTPIPDLQPPMAGKDSPFHTWYKDALEKVKALYAKALDLKKLVAKGVMVVAPGKEMFEREPGVFEVRIQDASLRRMINEGTALVEWSSSQLSAPFSNPDSLKTSFTPAEPGETTVRATFSLKAEPAVEAFVQTKVRVQAAQKTSVYLMLYPNPPSPNSEVAVHALPDSKSAGSALEFEWSCENCRITQQRGAKALLRTSGDKRGSISVIMKQKDGQELARTSLAFTVSAPDVQKDGPQNQTKTDEIRQPTVSEEPSASVPGKDASGKPLTPDVAIPGPPAPSLTNGQADASRKAGPITTSSTPEASRQAGQSGKVTPKSGPDRAGLTPIDQITPEQRKKLLDCLCLWSTSFNSASYDPVTKGDSPSCQDLSNGPCIGGEWGCGRFPLAPRMDDRPEQVKGCYTGNGIEYDKDKAAAFVAATAALHPLKKDSDAKKDEKKQPPLTVSISPGAETHLQPGQNVSLSAQVQGGKAPYTYAWSGSATGAATSVSFQAPAKPGSFPFTVTVKDSEGQNASQTVTLKSASVSLTLKKTSPSEEKVPVGTQVSFEASLSSDGKPVSASQYVIRWEPSTGARFARPEGPGATSNTATFARTGRTKVWAVALSKDGGALATVAESNQVELEIAGASISLTASPAEPLVGQEVTVTAVETPKIEDADAKYWWSDSPGRAGAGPTGNQRQWKFTVKEGKPVTVNATLKGTKGGEELAKASLTVTPQSYQVTAVSLGHAWGGDTSRTTVWKQGKGLVTLDKEIAADMDVGLRADITPAALSQQALRYTWTVNEGSTLTGNSSARETRAQRSTTGSIEATVEVRDDKNSLLGRGSVSVPVTVSAEEVRQGKTKSQELEKLKQQAKTAWSSGDLDLACESVHTIHQADPKFNDDKQYCSGRDTIHDLAKQGEQELAKGAFDKAKSKLEQAKAINANAKVLKALEEKIKTQGQAKTNTDAERSRRVDLIIAAAGDCSKENWEACRDKLTSALDGSKTVFGPNDASIVTKATELKAKAERMIKEKERTKAEAETQAQAKAKADVDAKAKADQERSRRVGLITAAAGDCSKENWEACRDKLTSALDGSKAVFGPNDASIVTKATELKTKAERMIKEKERATAEAQSQASAKSKDQAPSNSPDNGVNKQCEDLFKSALAQQKAGDGKGAAPTYKKILSLCPDHCKSMNNLGSVAQNENDLDAALAWYKKAYACNPERELYKNNIESIQKKLAEKNAGGAPNPSKTPSAPAAQSGGDRGISGINLARGKKATQSSVYTGTGVDQGPQHGVDGITRGRDPHDLVLTNLDNPAWWMVDLGGVGALSAVRIYNRLNPGVAANLSLEVLVSDDCSHWTRIYTHNRTRWEVLTIPVNTTGRFVKLRLNEQAGLQFYEVEVYGTMGEGTSKTNSPAPKSKEAESSIDGSYIGRFNGDMVGQATLEIRNGQVTGTVKTDGIDGRLTGTVNAQGRINCQLSGTYKDNILGSGQTTGVITGQVRGSQISGEWQAKSWAKGNGTWTANKR